MTSKRVTFETTECVDDVDLVTQTPWTDEAPSIFISYPTNDPKVARPILCYNGEVLGKFISDPANTLAKWVQTVPDRPITSTGLGGATIC